MPESTAFWADLARDLEDPEFRRAYVLESTRISVVDALMNAFEDARERAGLSKADLARAVGTEPASLRRLFTAEAPNPTIATVTDIATALGLRITLEAMPDAEHRLVARALTDEECRQPAALARVLQRRRSAV